MTLPTRVLVLVIDAAAPALVEQWAAEGALPHIAALRARGLTGPTRSVEGFYVGSTWPSFYTGMTPAGHGFHNLVQLRRGSYELFRFLPHESLAAEPFWAPLSRAGQRVAILDVPLSGLTPGLNGIQTVEWGSHDALYGFRAQPAALEQEIRSRFGPHPLGPSCDAERRRAEDYRALADVLVRGARRKGELTRRLLAQGPWDFFLQVFTEAHCAGHQCWHFVDPRHPAHDPEATARIGNSLREVYAAIDAAIGEIVGDASRDALVVLLVNHGMSYRFGAQFLLPEILVRLGVTAPPPAPPPARLDSLAELAARAWRTLPTPLRRGMEPLRRAVRDRPPDPPALAADPARSRCFPVNNGLAVGGIRLNLAGREPRGILQPGADAEAFCRQLAEDLLAITDERTGWSLIRRVVRTAELLRGPRLDDLPDLLVEWSDEAPTGSAVVGDGAGAVVRAHSPKMGTVEGANDYGRTGDHRPEGMFIAAGPGIALGRVERTVSVLDWAPTFARLLGAEVPAADGRPIPELLGARLPPR